MCGRGGRGSLAVLGPGGALVLRAALRDPDPYAADAARSALGLPPVAVPTGPAPTPVAVRATG